MESVVKFFDTLLGLPIHATVVHFAVVAGIVVSAVVIWRLARARKITARLIWAAALTFLIAFAAVLSGEALGTRTGFEQIERLGHDAYGSLVLILSFAQLVFLILLRWWDGRRRRRNAWLRNVMVLLLGVSSLLTIGASAMVMHTGTQAVWQGEIAHTNFGDNEEVE